MSLAALLRQAQDYLGSVHAQVDDLLVVEFPGWRPRFPLEMGWRFVPPDEIHVYNAQESEQAVAALRRAGFSSVVVHTHDALHFLTCRCLPAGEGT